MISGFVTIINTFFTGVDKFITTFVETFVRLFFSIMIFAITYEAVCHVMVFFNNWRERYSQHQLPQIPKVKREPTNGCCKCGCVCSKPAADIVDLSMSEPESDEEKNKDDIIEEIIQRG